MRQFVIHHVLYIDGFFLVKKPYYDRMWINYVRYIIFSHANRAVSTDTPEQIY